MLETIEATIIQAATVYGHVYLLAVCVEVRVLIPYLLTEDLSLIHSVPLS